MKNELMIASLAEGTAVGRYQIRSLLGAGGMGEVYRAWEASLERLVALKILRPELTGDIHRVERFVIEAKAASALNHPAIVSIYEIGDEKRLGTEGDSVHYIAMELVEGVTLDEWVRQSPALPLLLRQLATVAEGLAKAHGRGIIHRDLKPENIMMTSDGHPKVLDFGVAKLVDVDTGGTPSPSTRATVTEVRSLVGTAEYMAPEQIEGGPVDHRADIFSFGCVLFECLMGRSPFAGATKAETLHNVVNRDPAPLELANAPIAAVLQRILDRCLAKDRERRYDSARDLALDLREAASLAPSAPEKRRWLRLPRWPRLRAAASVAVVILAASLLLQPAADVVPALAGWIVPSWHPQIQKLEQVLATEGHRNRQLTAALGERDGEIARRGAEIDLLEVQIAQSERMRTDLEASYRGLLADVEQHLKRNNAERSQLGERVANAEGELRRVRQDLDQRNAQQARLGAIQRELSHLVETRIDSRGLILIAPGIFNHGRSRIDAAALGFLGRLAEQLRAYPEIKVTIEGHTDSSGSADDNLELSQERADEVRIHLERYGIDPERITTIGRGEIFPAFDEFLPQGKLANRRIEVILSH